MDYQEVRFELIQLLLKRNNSCVETVKRDANDLVRYIHTGKLYASDEEVKDGSTEVKSLSK